MQLARIRLITPTLPASEKHVYSDLGYEYAKALQDSGVFFKLISSTGGPWAFGDFASGENEPTRWGRFKEEINAMLTDCEVNLVVGSPTGIGNAWTLGMHNVAVVFPAFRDWTADDVTKAKLNDYDEVWIRKLRDLDHIEGLKSAFAVLHYEESEKIAKHLRQKYPFAFESRV